MKKKVVELLLIAFLSALITTPAGSQERPRRTSASEEVGEGDVVRVDTSLVTVPVSVMDRQGRFLYDLRSEDFRIFENSVEQQITFFESVEVPFTVILMLDTSSSVWRKLDQIKKSAVTFLDQLRPNDSVMVISFAHRMTVHCEPTDDRERLRQVIDGIGKGMSTHLYDAVAKVMKKKLTEIRGRKAVVIFTDGVDESGDKTAKQTLHYAQELDALIYTIRFDTYDERMDAIMQAQNGVVAIAGIFGRFPFPGSPMKNGRGETLRDMYERGKRYLQDLSSASGGRYFEASRDLRDLDHSFAQIAEELRRQYRLGYYPTIRGTTPERRTLRVRVSRSDVAVRARDSYVYVPHRSKN